MLRHFASFITTTSLIIAATSASAQDSAPEAQGSATPLGEASQEVQEQTPALAPTSPLFEHAETYAAFHNDVDAAQARELRSGADLDAVMDSLAAYYNDDSLANAHIAYAALVAQQYPEFLDDVRAVADYYGPQVAVSALTQDPIYVTGFTSASDASDSVVSALEQDGDRITLAAERYREAAYDLQAESWARRRARDRQDRLSALETASSRLDVNFASPDAMRLAPSDSEAVAAAPSAAQNRRTGAVSALLIRQRRDAETAQPNLTLQVGEAQLAPDERRVGRILAVAALQAIRDTDPATLEHMLSDPRVERCISWAKLQLAQCVAAGHFKYEDSFCISQHALNDVALCLRATQEPANASDDTSVSH